MLALGLALALALGPTYPVGDTYAAPGPYATTTATVQGAGGTTYDLFRPADYAALGFASPIVTWGDGTDATPAMYTTLLTHLASYGFTVIAPALANTGSGREIDAAARYLVTQDTTPGSVFAGRLDVHDVAAVGHSQGAGGAVRAAVTDPRLITSVLTFSLPSTIWVSANPDCPTAADCLFDPADLTQPVFFIGTHGLIDSIIASPATERSYYDSVAHHAALGLIQTSDGQAADHSSIQDPAYGGHPAGELGYATAWLEYTLLGDGTAAAAFTGGSPELPRNAGWPGSDVK